MSGKGQKVKAYTELRAEYERKIQEQTRVLEGLKSELAGVEKLYRASEGLLEAPTMAVQATAQRKVKKYVLDAVISRGDRGVNAAEVLLKAREEGRELNASSVSSLLSRLKREGVLRIHNDRYYPVKSDAPGGTVTALRPVEAA